MFWPKSEHVVDPMDLPSPTTEFPRLLFPTFCMYQFMRCGMTVDSYELEDGTTGNVHWFPLHNSPSRTEGTATFSHELTSKCKALYCATDIDCALRSGPHSIAFVWQALHTFAIIVIIIVVANARGAMRTENREHPQYGMVVCLAKPSHVQINLIGLRLNHITPYRDEKEVIIIK
jgi:hypothetical protein